LEVVTMKLKCLYIPAAAASLALVIASTANAQGPGRMMGDREWGIGGEGWGIWRGGPGPWSRGSDGMLNRIEGRLAFIRTELKITEAQTPAWSQLAEAIRTAAKNQNERMKAILSRQERAKTLPERLDAHEQLLSARLDETRQIKGSLNALYAALSQEQKKEADDIVPPMAGMGGPHRWGQ
jgi:hypothetical protein